MIAVGRIAVLFAALACAAVPQAGAQPYPSGPLRIVVPFPPGGGTDILARLIAQKLAESWGQPAVVENRPGAGGTIGSAAVAKAAPDGHTILMMPAGIAAHPSLYRNLPYDPGRDLAPVSHLASGPLVLVVHPSLPARSVKELVALAKKHPGAINFGSAGAGTLPHLSAELFNSMSGIRMVHVPYKGAGAAVADVLAGRVPVYFMNILQSLSLVKAGKLRALAVTTPERTPIAPEIPAIAEAGLEGYDMTNWYGMFAPAATRREVTARLSAEVARILRERDIVERLAQDGMVVVASTPERFAEFFARERAKLARVIEAAGIQGTL
ncbi:MAG TPA: tripartite tricarboxylate transporter substrate binding protein [Burkholderiales bacterium]|nr:tripartite tricarboxylate transporter substrate binding protein [Burkholderiales bacterium]